MPGFYSHISRTYCDPKSFVWEHEFKAFIEEASKDQFGLKVKLPNGNVAGRVLPVRIHDLDSNDIQLCETVLGSVLRGVEFVYKEPGVNRSLTPKDKEKKNLNGTIYRNQINKVALAIKEIVLGLQGVTGVPLKGGAEHHELFGETNKEKELKGKPKSHKLRMLKLLGTAAILAILVVSAVILWSKIFRHNNTEKLKSSGEKISIAVLPFQNMTNASTWNGWQDIIQINLISYISASKELNVRQKETIISLMKAGNQDQNASFSLSVANTLSKKLDADIFIYGSIQKAGSAIRLIAQLIDTRTGNVLKSIEVNGPSKTDNIIGISDTLRKKVTDYLMISKLIKENPWYGQFPEITRSPDAYRYFIYGEKLKNSFLNQKDLATAEDWYKRSLAADSNFLFAMSGLKDVYNFMGKTEEALKWVLKMYSKKERWPTDDQIGISWFYANYFEAPEDRLKYLDQMLQIDDKNPTLHWNLGYAYNEINQPTKAIPELEKAIDLLHTEVLTTAGIMVILARHIVNQASWKRKESFIKKLKYMLRITDLLRQTGLNFH